MAVFLDYLRRSGTDWSLHPTRDEVMREYDRIWSLVGSRQIEELVDLPLMNNPDVLDVLDVFTEAVTPSLFVDENLCSLIICRMVNLSLEHGNSDGSCFAYVWFAIIAGPRFSNYKDGFRFGRLGYELVEKRGLTRYQARTYMSFGNIVMPWTKHVRPAANWCVAPSMPRTENGDLTFAAYSCSDLITNFLAVGDPLAEVQPEAESGVEFAQKARFGLVVDIITAQLGFIRTLRGLTPTFGSFNDEGFDELQFERHLASNPLLALPEFWYWTRKVQARFFAGDYAVAVDASLHAQRLLWTSPSQFETAEFRFYGALSHAACLGLRICRPETAAFRGSDGSPPATRSMGGELSGELRESRGTGRCGDRANRGPRPGRRCASTSRRSARHERMGSYTLRASPTKLRPAFT